MTIVKDPPEVEIEKRRKGLNAHDVLVRRGEKWLNSQGCKVVIRDEMRAFTTEIPDVIGWRDGRSILIECKVSRADFLSDKNKSFRQRPEEGMGDWRFYLCPPGIISPDELSEGWGLLYAHPKIIQKVHGVPANTRWWQRPFKGNRQPEMQILVSALRRLSLRGYLEEIYDQSYLKSNEPDQAHETEPDLFEDEKAG